MYRVYPDAALHKVMVAKAERYFKQVILPELVAKHFSLNANNVISNLLRETANLGAIICSCRAAKAGQTVLCSGKDCLFKEFHFRYELFSLSRAKKILQELKVSFSITKKNGKI